MSENSEIYNDASETCSVSERSEAEDNLADLSKHVSLNKTINSRNLSQKSIWIGEF